MRDAQAIMDNTVNAQPLAVASVTVVLLSVVLLITTYGGAAVLV